MPDVLVWRRGRDGPRDSRRDAGATFFGTTFNNGALFLVAEVADAGEEHG
jgi:hypothetical protein